MPGSPTDDVKPRRATCWRPTARRCERTCCIRWALGTIFTGESYRLTSRLGPRVCLPIRIPHVAPEKVRVELGRGDVSMAEKLLHHAEVRPTI